MKAVIFGGTGFVGRYIVRHLCQKGYVVTVVCRSPDKAKFLKPYGKVGQVVPMAVSLQDEAGLKEVLQGASVVINCIGILFEKGKRSFENMHIKVLENIATAASAAGVKKFIHVSALGVSNKSASKYARTKADAEQLLWRLIPTATVLRPSVIFGPEDNFLNQFANMSMISPFLPLIGGGETKFQPVFVEDVALAAMRALEGSSMEGKCYQLGGDKVYSFKEILQLITKTIGRKKLLFPIPFFLAKIMAFFAEFMPTPFLTRDQLKLLKTDNIVEKSCSTFETIGITPHSLEELAPALLKRYKKRS